MKDNNINCTDCNLIGVDTYKGKFYCNVTGDYLFDVYAWYNGKWHPNYSKTMEVPINCPFIKKYSSNKLYYISIEESESIYTVYNDWVFTIKEKCMDLYKWAVSEYGEDKVEICNFELNPSIGKFRIKEENVDD